MRRRRQHRAGDFNTRVILYRQDPTTTANTDGEIPEAAQEVARRWAEVVPVTGRLQHLVGANEANVTHLVRVHYDDTTEDLTPKNWIVTVQGSRRFNIEGVVDVDNRHRVVELQCTERV